MSADRATQHLDHLCRQVTSGREAARELSLLAKDFDLKEPEFRLLWRLNAEPQGDSPEGPVRGLDQTSLSASLGCSPAQVSVLVERQRAQGYLIGCPALDDRRRQVWQLTSAGKTLIQAIVDSVEQARRKPFRTLSMVDQVPMTLRDSA